MDSENVPEQRKLSELESKLSNTQLINKDLIKEQILAKKIIGLVFNDRLFIEKAAGCESEELQEFIQQELHKRYTQAPDDAEKDAMAGAIKNMVCSTVGSGIYEEAMKIQDPAERYNILVNTFKKSLLESIQKKYGATINKTRMLEKNTAAKDGEILQMKAKIESLQKELEEGRNLSVNNLEQHAISSGNATGLAAAFESLQKEHFELSQAFNTLQDIATDYLAFVKSIEELKNYGGEIDE